MRGCDVRLEDFYARYKTVQARSGEIGYFDSAEDREGNHGVVLFLHGIGTNGYLWRNVIDLLQAERRCLAIDLPLHGRSPAAADQDFSFPGLAAVLEDFCEALGLTGIDLVGNDTGGGIAQVFAARRHGLLRSLVLTNCEAHDNVPPPAFKASVQRAARGQIAPNAARLLENLDLVRTGGELRRGYENPERLSDETIRCYLRPVLGTQAAARQYERALTSLEAEDLLAVEPELKKLPVPALIVWGNADVFFETQWAYWLRDTLPGAREVVEIEGGKLFFPEERAAELAECLRAHWASLSDG